MERTRLTGLASVLKRALSCLAILAGVSLGFLGFALLAWTPVFSYFHPNWYSLAGFVLGGSVAVSASLLAVRRRKLAGVLFILIAPVIGWCFAWPERFGPPHGAFSASRFLSVFDWVALVFAVPGVFWVLTWWLHWPPVVVAPLAPGTRIRLTALVAVFLFVTCVTGSICLRKYDLEGECRGFPSLIAQRSPDQTVFIARIVFVGYPYEPLSPFASWSIVRVEHRFWGLPSWAPGLLILRGYFKKGERGSYLVDGRRSPELLTHFLPMIEPYPCGHTAPLDHAVVDLRLLHDGPPKTGIRIIGRVYRNIYPRGEPAPGVKLLLTGPEGNFSTTTDEQGVYDLVGVPPGHYSVDVESGSHLIRRDKAEGDVKSGEVWESELIARPVRADP